MKLVRQTLHFSLTALLGLVVARDAFALSCTEIMNMVNVNVPVTIIVQTIEDSGEQFTTDDIRCLVNEGAPSEVITAAKTLTAGADSGSSLQRGDVGVSRQNRSQDIFGDDEQALGQDRTGNQYTTTGSSAPDPDQIKEAIKLFRAKKPLTASLMLYELLEDGTFPEHEAKIQYYLARCLYDLNMYHTSQYYFLQVLRKGTQNPYFKHALPKLVAIARYTGDNSELIRVVAKVPPDAFPRSARNHLYYLMGVRFFEEDDLSHARKYFSQISSKSELYLRSKYYEGIIFNKQGKLKSAVRAFRDVVREEVELASPEELQRVRDLQNLALIDIARVYYSIQRFEEAAKYYALVDRDSTYWPEALFESAWAKFMLNDLNMALGQILTAQSPFFIADNYIPEANILKALTFFNLCEYDEVERLLLKFEDQTRPMYTELKGFVQSYATTEGKKLADQAYETYFERWPRNSTLQRSIFDRILRNKDLAGIINQLQIMDAEVDLIDNQKTRWRESAGAHLKKIIEANRQRYKRRAGLLFLSEAARLTAYLGDMLSQSEIIRFEVVDAQRVDYQFKMQNPDLEDSFKGLELDFATSVDFIYWPFNGEFWQDELGYYHYTEQGSCR